MDQGYGNWVTIQARRYPDRIAYIDAGTGERRSYGEVERRTNAIADVLARRGVGPGDRVALLTLNSIETMEVLIAVAKLGAIAVPINFRLSPGEIEFILTDSGASTVFFNLMFLDLVNAAVTDATRVRDRFVVPDSTLRAEGGESDLEAMITRGHDDRVSRRIAESDVAVIMYTSGTTGRPKGAMLTHGNLVWNAVNAVTCGRGYSREDVTITAAPLFHIGALGVNTLPLLFAGGACVIMESFHPVAWLEAMQRHGVTNAFLVPAMWAAVAAAPGFAEADWSSISIAVSGGAPCPVPVIRTFREAGIPFTEGLGMTETSPICALLGEEDVVRKAGSVGKPVNNVEFALVDDMDRPVPAGEVGELVIRGPNVFAGYWNNPVATEEALRGGWFHSGDLAVVDEEGFYTIVDRKKDMVITGGENVYSAEVEAALIHHPDIGEVAVVGKPDERWGEAVTAFIARVDGARITEEEVIAWAREQMAHFKVPKAVEFIEALPRNATGKVLKRELRRRWDQTGSAVYR